MTHKELVLSLIVSVYNEEAVLEQFWEKTRKVLLGLDISTEIIFVNDGSTDRSAQILEQIAQTEECVRVINFSRNYGHEAAMIAGLDHSHGDINICMDADLQHPPEKIIDIVARYHEGYEIVNMVRSNASDTTLFKKITSYIFYKLINIISPVDFEPNASDFFMVSHRVANILKNDYRERTRFIRGFIQMIGYKRTTVGFVAPERFSGNSKYSFLSLLRFSFATVLTFSKMPIHFLTIFGALCGIGSICLGIFEIIVKLLGHSIPGYPTIVTLITFFFSIQIFTIGIIGEYIGYLFLEVKKRPIYTIDTLVQKEYTKKYHE